MNKKENWIEETINHIDTVNRVEVPSELDELLNSVYLRRNPVQLIISPITKWAIAASVILLIGINSLTMLKYSDKSNNSNNETNVIYKEYFSYINE